MIMRGILFIGLVVVLLIIGVLVVKNMGVDDSSAVSETQAEKYIEKAENIADRVNQKVKGLDDKVSGSD